MLTENEKIACVAAVAFSIATITAIAVNAKIKAMKKRVNRCEKRLDDLENLCTDPRN